MYAKKPDILWKPGNKYEAKAKVKKVMKGPPGKKCNLSEQVRKLQKIFLLENGSRRIHDASHCLKERLDNCQRVQGGLPSTNLMKQLIKLIN